MNTPTNPPITRTNQRKLQPPRIWIGSLADYNAGRLHGDWV